jgi:GAF domain-containing protein
LVQPTSAADRASLADEQAALRRVAMLVARGAPPNEVLDAVAVEVGRLIGADLAVLSRYDEGGGVTVLASRPDGTARELPFAAQHTIDPESLTAAVLRTGRPARIEDFAEAPGPWAAQSRELGYRSAVGAPVTVQGRLWGVMIVTSTDACAWPPDTEDRLADFTELLATAIADAEGRGELAASEARARALAEEQAALRRVATLAAREPASEAFFSAVAREVASVLNVPGALVERFEADGASVSIGAAYASDLSGAERLLGVGARTPPDPGSLTAQVFETHRTARVDDFSTLPGALGDAARAAGLGSGCAGPIVVNGDLWGMLAVFSQAGTVLPVGTENRLHDFIELVATAIANYEARADLAASEARARELAEEQAALRRVATLVAESASAETLLSAVAEEVARVLAVPEVTIDRFDQDGSATTVVASWCTETAWPVGSRWPLDGPSLAATIWKTGRPARIDDYTGLSGSIAEALRDRPTVRGVGVPIVVRNRVWGMIGAGPMADDAPEAVQERLARFTELVATAIANSENRAEVSASEARAREFAEEQAALRRVATLVAESASAEKLLSTVAEELARVLALPVVTIDRFDQDGSATTVVASWHAEGNVKWPVGSRWPLDGPSVAATVWKTGRPAKIDDYTGLPGSIAAAFRGRPKARSIGVPIVVGNRVWGMIGAGSSEDDVPEAVDERLARFTELVATAIANSENRAELFASEARARELANEQAALRRVATLVARGASPDELFSAVSKEVAGVIDVPVVSISRYEADGTFTILGNAGETSLWIGTRWPVWGIVGTILATGRPSRQDDFTSLPGPVGDPLRDALILSWREKRSVVGVPIIVEGSIWGLMFAAAKPGTLVPAGTEERLARFTELVATAVSNATTRTELLASRARLVSAADETRRRLERDLHDGIQQWLVALALRARKAAGPATAGESAVQELAGLADDLVAVTDELREISRGIHPAILSDAGLDDALGALARRSTIRVDLDVSFQGRYDPTLEATVYYVAAESITNAVKHAQASTVTVRGGRHDGTIELEIRDDGVGGADPQRGTGLIGLKDRVETLGGTISFASPAGAGTTIRAKLPARPRDGEDPPLPRSDEGASAPASG